MFKETIFVVYVHLRYTALLFNFLTVTINTSVFVLNRPIATHILRSLIQQFLYKNYHAKRTDIATTDYGSPYYVDKGLRFVMWICVLWQD